jgi:hypothetical protein
MAGGRLVRRSAAAALLLAAGCRAPELYRWGAYEDSVAAMYATSGGYDPAREVQRLTDQVAETEHRGELVPPGVRAHLGYLLLEAGNAERGVAYLLAEKAAYPESATFIDGMLARLRKERT